VPKDKASSHGNLIAEKCFRANHEEMTDRYYIMIYLFHEMKKKILLPEDALSHIWKYVHR
jgi:hypothetical protein